jgi:hypothetical protein
MTLPALALLAGWRAWNAEAAAGLSRTDLGPVGPPIADAPLASVVPDALDTRLAPEGRRITD